MQRTTPRLLFICALLLTFFVYHSGLNGPFIFDDSLNIVSNQHLRMLDFSLQSLREAAFSSPAGLLQRPLSMLSFALNFHFHSGDLAPYSFKLTNLLIHMLNGLVVYALTRMLACFLLKHRQSQLPAAYPDWLALAVSTAWLLHPLNLTSVLYVVQRMNSLAALFTFLGLCCYLWGRIRVFDGQRGGMAAILAGIFVFTPLALLSKENGALLPFFMLAMEVTLFKFEAARPIARRFLIGFFVICTAVPILAIVSHIALHPDWLFGGYLRREFSLPERLMTESRVVWFYLRLIILPSTSLMGVFHDDISVSHGLFDPYTTLPSILGIVALPLSAWLLRKRLPLVSFGILFYLVGHSMESTIFPLELVHEHRNYLPAFGILLAFFHLLLEPLHAANTQIARRFVAVLLIGLFAAGTFSRANDWANPFALWQAEVDHHPNSPRTNSEIGSLYAHYTTADPIASAQSYLLARHFYEQATTLQKNNVNGLFGLIQLSISHGKPVEKQWLAELAYRLENEVVPANINDKLVALAACRMKENCPLSVTEIEALVRTPLRNPRITGYDKVLAYSALTFYLINVAADYPAALESMNSSIELAPHELEQRLTLIKFLIALQRPEEARNQLTLLKQVDLQGRRAREIKLLEKDLNQGN